MGAISRVPDGPAWSQTLACADGSIPLPDLSGGRGCALIIRGYAPGGSLVGAPPVSAQQPKPHRDHVLGVAVVAAVTIPQCRLRVLHWRSAVAEAAIQLAADRAATSVIVGAAGQ